MKQTEKKSIQPSFYITTTLPYVNNDPHVGFAMEIIRADIIARAKKIQGYQVFFNTGTDEHGQKLWADAQKAGKDVKDYVDEYAAKFKGLKDVLGLLPDIHFIRTTDPKHQKAAQEFWKRCNDNGYIYKKNYQSKYCIGCELEKTDSELLNGCCPLHTNKPIEIREEENYFFRFSDFNERLISFYNANPEFVIPNFRFNEVKSFVESGLQDFSISRLKEKMPWGIGVPGDESQVMYVWFDALVNYVSTIGWPENMQNFERWWPVVQFCGKDNIRQQAAIWQAMLMAAGIPNSEKIIINGFITGEGGIKMSKSLGNTINPYDVVTEYGTEALRYFIARELSRFEDSPFTMTHFKDAYNASLANGLGNVVNRVMKMAETYLARPLTDLEAVVPEGFFECFDNYDINAAAEMIWNQISEIDAFIQEKKPFIIGKEDPQAATQLIEPLVRELYNIAFMLSAILPETSEKIEAAVLANQMPSEPLFLRKD